MENEIEILSFKKLDLYLAENLDDFWREWDRHRSQQARQGVALSSATVHQLTEKAISFTEKIVDEYISVYSNLLGGSFESLNSIKHISELKESCFKLISQKVEQGFFSEVTANLTVIGAMLTSVPDSFVQEQLNQYKKRLATRFDLRIEEIKFQKPQLSDPELEKEILTILQEKKAFEKTGKTVAQKVFTDDYGLPKDRVGDCLVYLESEGHVVLIGRNHWQLTARGKKYLREPVKTPVPLEQKQKSLEEQYDVALREKYGTSTQKVHETLRKIGNDPIASIIEDDIRNAVMCLEYKLYKPALIASGSVLEGLLAAKLRKFAPKPEKPKVEKMRLNDLLKHPSIEKEVGKTNIKLADAVRDFRNYVHPFVYMRQIENQDNGDEILPDNATVACRIIFIFLKTLKF